MHVLRPRALTPLIVATFAAPAHAQCGMRSDARLEGSAAWIAGGDHLWVNWTGEPGLRGYTVAPEGTPTESFWIPTGASPASCLERWPYLYVAARSSLKVFDLSAGPREIASIDHGRLTGGVLQVMEADGDLLAINTISRLLLFNIALPAETRLQDSSLSGGLQGVSLSGGMLAISWVNGPRLGLYDVSGPGSPRLLGESRSPLDEYYGQLVLQGSTATVITDQGVVVLDASDPTALRRDRDCAATSLGRFSHRTRVSRVGGRFATQDVYTLDDEGAPIDSLLHPSDVIPGNSSALLPHHVAFQSPSRVDICKTDVPHPPVFHRIHVRIPFVGWTGVVDASIVPEEGVTYQWFGPPRDVPISRSPRLLWDNLPYLWNYPTYCVATNACGSTRSMDAVFWTAFPTDYNLDGYRRTQADFDAYVADFEAGDLKADTNGDDFIDFFDYDTFVRTFTGGG